MPEQTHTFEAAFVFSRGARERVRGADGVERQALWHEPRFDHDADGAPIGLLVEGLPEVGRADRLRLKPGAITAPETSTVLHELIPPGAEAPDRRAFYARGGAVFGLIESRLRARGHHRRLTVVAGHLRNWGGRVMFDGRPWGLGALVTATPDGAAIGTAAESDPPLLLEG